MDNSIDALTNLPVTSLYGDKLAPVQTDLTDIATEKCKGVMLHVTDPATFHPVIRIIKELHPQWFPTGKQHLDLLSGISGPLRDFFSVLQNIIFSR
jgi:uncharacterized protein YbbC (DUF1343 family)